MPLIGYDETEEEAKFYDILFGVFIFLFLLLFITNYDTVCPEDRNVFSCMMNDFKSSQ
jgi:hypothetical protein